MNAMFFASEKKKALNMIIQCKCDCGTEFEEYNKWGYKREYVQGHQFKGKSLSDEHKNKLSESKKGEKNPNYGKPLSDITKQKMSVAHRGEKNFLFGKERLEETKLKISKSKKEFFLLMQPDNYCPILIKE